MLPLIQQEPTDSFPRLPNERHHTEPKESHFASIFMEASPPDKPPTHGLMTRKGYRLSPVTTARKEQV